MDSNQGDVSCSKCKGKGTLPFEGALDQTNYVCTKCEGKGKVDWVTNAMAEDTVLFNTHGYLKTMEMNNDVTFYSNKKTMLEIKEGGFYIEGRKTKDDKKIYERFNKFMKECGY